MRQKNSAAIYLVAACAAVTWTQSASAKIKCTADGYQDVNGALLATPYCQDQFVSTVAREYGVYAPADKIRNNPNFKRHVCRLIGQDIRIKETCDQVTPSARGRF
ncbi:hypothetical protein [Hyphomicrobium sp.]|jgi:hypothetical protein|uniref:hypothetical protein n=1 Tax=Hyphomicrobium sp. TaxID=82 RepID=UPI002C3A895F|nr:hypothetical protein [Hyphomicrobium sp.]HVZ04638.1 hypothetical protein [Hyphomicrobium sp.]